ncbi:TonB-dependent receptor [Niastella caeni]|uniref:TonB-dependent receptor n=1 Tax=Niastella caeni TaxID=2569763 RepID=A0A4S8HNK8_9BACT|nr:TonB-dependent receptor [Niastella caeni]THU36049.1 TonB-dependent receptor [Niastella caeni]
MRIVTLFILLLFTAQFVSAQNKISGKVMDAMNRFPLPDATITIINPVDSAAVGFAVVDKAGLFEIKNLGKGNFKLGVTYTGYRPFTKDLNITQSQFVIDLDTIFLQPDTSMMTSVVVQAPPIIVKKDTIEFRASSFKTKPNATVEDLLKKLPGVEVDKEGNIAAQGEEITKVYVDGKEFFLNDPKLATKNLSSDMVESVQVFDDMSDQAKFTKIDDGSRKRTINIKLKKDRKKGVFGRTSASVGTSDRYEASASLNAFDNSRQISVLGGANNINKLGFTNNDLVSAMGGMGNVRGGRGGGGGGRGGGGGGGRATDNGNTKSWSTGINYRDEWGAKIDFSGSYFVSQTTTSNYSQSFRQSVFANDSAAYTTSVSNSGNTNTNHRFGFRLEYAIDSMNSLLITPTFNLQQAGSSSDESLVTQAANLKVNYKAIEGESHRSNSREGKTFNNDFLFRHRFRKPGRTFTIGWTTALNGSDGNGLNTSPYYFYNADSTAPSRIDNRRQRNDQYTRSFNNTISSSVTEMIDSSMVWELNYAYTINRSNSDRNTFDFNSVTQEYDSINKPLTNYFENLFTANRLGTNFRVKRQKYDYQFGGAVNFASLANLSNRATTGKDSTMRQTYTNFFPNASFNYNPAPRKNLRFNYRGSTRAPGISQLQDVADVSNPLNVRTGNPELKQEFTHNINVSYNSFNLSNFLYFNLNGGANIVSNKIVNSISQLDTAVLLTKPENLNGAQGFTFSGTIGIPLKKVTTGRRSPVNLNLTSSVRFNRDVSKLYNAINYNYTKSFGQRISFNYFIQDKLDLQANANFNYNDAKYSVQKTLNYTYFDHHYSLDVTYTMFKKIMINNDFDYYINTGRAQGFNQPIPLWNAYISCLLFKKQNGELRISGIDLLNQNKSITRSVGDNYIEDTYTQVLQRYFFVSFLYNFRNFGKGMFPGRDSRERGGRRY